MKEFDFEFSSDIQIRGRVVEDKFFVITKTSKAVFDCLNDAEPFIKNYLQQNIEKILKITGYKGDHKPLNEYPQEECPYCKASPANICLKHSIYLSWETSSRNKWRYFPEIMNVKVETIDYEVYMKPTRQITLSVLRKKDGILSLYSKGRWFSYIV